MFRALITVILCCALPAQAQTRKIYPQYGISIAVPDKWRAQESGDYLLMISDTEPGLVALTLNRATDVTQLKATAGQGIEDDGVSLHRSGDFEQVGIEGLGAEFTGTYDGVAAKAFVAGVINPFGRGVTIAAITSHTSYGPAQVALVKEIADGLQFAQPVEPQAVTDWNRKLPNRKLTYMRTTGGAGSSYTDSSGQVYSSYSGTSSRHSIHFCGNGRFSASNSASTSFDNSGGFGRIAGNGAGEGTWAIEPGNGDTVLLVLAFDDGERQEYDLLYDGKKTTLDGSRYFYTDSDWCR